MEQLPFPAESQPASFGPPPPLPPEIDLDSVRQAREKLMTEASEQLTVLEARVKELVQQSHKRSNRIATAVSGYVFTLFVLSITTFFLRTEIFLAAFFLLTPVAIVGFLCWAIYGGAVQRSRSRQIGQELTCRNETRAIGPLIDTLRLPNDYKHRFSIDALIRLLPYVGPGDAELLNAERRALLWNRLSSPVPVARGDAYDSSQAKYEREIEFRVAALQAFTQVGDSRMISGVAQLVQGKARTQGEERIQEAARICLAALRERAGQRYSNQTLLRPAGAAEMGAEILLRPATGAPKTPSEQLLRPDVPLH